MLYQYLFPLVDTVGAFNVFKYLSFRAFGAAVTALMLALFVGPAIINYLKKMSFGQVVREEGPESHYKKSGTPTMGGLIMLFALFISMLLWMNFSSVSTWIVLFVTVCYGLLGFVDDYKKVVLKNTKGITAGQKLAAQFIVAGITAWLFIQFTDLNSELRFPFLKNFTIDLGVLYIPFGMLVIVGTSNAANLTDGLDGLLVGIIIITMVTFGLLTYLAGNAIFAEYLDIPYVKGVGELAVFCAAVAAAGLGFLWFNFL